MRLSQVERNKLYERMKQRDSALDGRVYVGVMTTGIYCRPVCRARIPLRKNIRFFPSAAAAEVAGFHPCLRCRPETAPFCPAWNGTKTTVERALKLIDQGALDTQSVESLADRLGVGSRHLSRLFKQLLGASPSQIAQTRRVQKAKCLLSESRLSIADITASEGFQSQRSMRDAFNKLYGRPPSTFR